MAVSIYSESASPQGSSTYRFDGVDVPAQFKPQITFSANENKARTNINVRVHCTYPLAKEVDGVWQAPNTFSADFSFTALQSVIATTERERVVDEMIQFLTDHKAEILRGSVI